MMLRRTVPYNKTDLKKSRAILVSQKEFLINQLDCIREQIRAIDQMMIDPEYVGEEDVSNDSQKRDKGISPVLQEENVSESRYVDASDIR